jgi:hypothetical protein
MPWWALLSRVGRVEPGDPAERSIVSDATLRAGQRLNVETR